MTAVAVTQRNRPSQTSAQTDLAPMSLREAICQVSDSSRNLLGLLALSNVAQRELESGSREMTLDGVISKVVLKTLLGALHYRDHVTLRHSRRVALLAVGLAQHLGWEGRHLRVLEVAALLHDIGKIGVPDNILYKPGKLTAAEVDLIDTYQRIGINVLQACHVDSEVLKIVDECHRSHKMCELDERSLHKVHIGARILAVADAYESLFTDQAYRVAKPHEEIIEIMMQSTGKQFDTNVVSSLARWVQQDGLPFAAQTVEVHNKGSRRPPLSLEECADAMAICQIFSYLQMLETLYDGFHIVDSNRRFVVWNRGVERLAGRSAIEMLGTEWSPEVFREAKHSKTKLANASPHSTIDDAIKNGKTVLYRMPYQCHDGPEISLELQSVPLMDAEGRLHGVAEMFRNISNENESKEMAKMQSPEIKRLKLQASRDALTNVANRGELERQLRQFDLQYKADPTEPYCVIFADADYFKRVNDTYGHHVGDQVLIDIAKHFCDETYSGEIVGRYGGEEFVLLCPTTTLSQAVQRANRLRCSLKEINIGGVDKLKISCSFGVAQIEPGDTTESIVCRADRALYAAKQAGRDRVWSYTINELNSADTNSDGASLALKQFEYSDNFSAFIASEMVIHKLGAFINEHGAELIDVKQDRVLLRMVGAAGLLAFRKSAFDRQGVEVELLMNGVERADRSKKLRINVEMRPHGKFRDETAFSMKTHEIMMELKRYFAAE